MYRLLWMLLLMGLVLPAYADNTAKRTSIIELMEIMKVDSMMDAIYSQLDRMFVNTAKEMNLQAAELPLFERYMEKLSKAMREEMSWAKMKDPMIAIYQKHYTEKEIKDLLVFYRSETGRKLIEKMPLVMQESMTISQDLMKNFMPKAAALAKELRQEIAKARGSK